MKNQSTSRRREHQRIVHVAALLAFVSAVWWLADAARPGAASLVRGRIAFVRYSSLDVPPDGLFAMDVGGLKQDRVLIDVPVASDRFAFSPNGDEIAYADKDHQVSLVSTRTRDRAQVTDAPIRLGWPTWNAAGDCIAVEATTDTGPRIGVLRLPHDGDAATSDIEWVAGPYAVNPDWSWASDEIAFAQEGGLFVLPAPGEPVRTLVPAGDAMAMAPRWSPSGEHLAFAAVGLRASEGRGLYVVRSDGTGLQCVVPNVTSAPAWSPCGKYIAYAQQDVHMVEIATGRRHILLPGDALRDGTHYAHEHLSWAAGQAP